MQLKHVSIVYFDQGNHVFARSIFWKLHKTNKVWGWKSINVDGDSKAQTFKIRPKLTTPNPLDAFVSCTSQYESYTSQKISMTKNVLDPNTSSSSSLCHPSTMPLEATEFLRTMSLEATKKARGWVVKSQSLSMRMGGGGPTRGSPPRTRNIRSN